MESKKCSSKQHSEADAKSYCGKCGIYLCNKCESAHSMIFQNNQIFNSEKEKKFRRCLYRFLQRKKS